MTLTVPCYAHPYQENKELLSNYDRWLRQLVENVGVEDSVAGRLTPPLHSAAPLHPQSPSDMVSSRSSRYGTSLSNSPLMGSDRWRHTYDR